MSSELNSKVFVWGLGVIQPATPEEVKTFLLFMLSSDQEIEFDLLLTTQKLIKVGLIRCVSKKNDLYSLTHEGDGFLGNNLRSLKDKERLFLLKSIRDVSFNVKGASERNMSGVSPLERLRSSTKVSPRPEFPLSSGPLPQNQRKFWPRVYEQLGIGSQSVAPLHSINLNFYSVNALPKIDSIKTAVISVSELMGISSYLLYKFCSDTEKYYREFEIPKKSGKGLRSISAPRAFIKTTQYWILDYFLYRLRQHESCFSYRNNVSIKDNASIHLNKKFILCVDIESFFDNITVDQVKACIERSKINPYLAILFSKILTLNDSLPQGAPTSPLISNSHLYEFDEKLSKYCATQGLSYSRYADDLTIGSDEYGSLKGVENLIKKELHLLGLSVNNTKTRIISSNSCQIVTGIAINNGEVRPTRKYRKKIRALFHKAQVEGDFDLLPQLYGHLNYLNSFKNGDTSNNIKKYQSIIDNLKLARKIGKF